MGLHLRARADTTRADTTGTGPTPSTDTTAAADSTATRGPGRTPGHVAPRELGTGTTGGNPGGGGGTPSGGGVLLNPDYMGSADLTERSTDSLVKDAIAVVWNKGPKEAERRLNGLVNQGYLDAATRDSVQSRIERAQEAYSRLIGQ